MRGIDSPSKTKMDSAPLTHPGFRISDRLRDPITLLSAGIVILIVSLQFWSLHKPIYINDKVLDLGEWWFEETDGLPLPLGGNAIRRDLGPDAVREVSRLLKESIQYSLDNREEALAYAMEYACLKEYFDKWDLTHLKIEAEDTPTSVEQLNVRIQSFMESLV